MELRRLVCALGIAQIVSWGTLFYSIAVLGPPMARTLGVTDVVLYGSFTAGLFLSGIASPWIGIRIDINMAHPLVVLEHRNRRMFRDRLHQRFAASGNDEIDEPVLFKQ